MKAQANAVEAMLSRIPGRKALLARVAEIELATSGQVSGVARADNGRLFFQRRDAGDNQFRLVYRDTLDGVDHLVFDPGVQTRSSGRNHALMDFEPSPDGRMIACAVQVGGSEFGLLHVLDLATGKALIEPVDRIRYASVNWLADSSGFFYSRLRAGYESLPRGQRFDDRTVHYRSLAEPANDRIVFSASGAPTLKLPVFASGSVAQVLGTKTAILVVTLGVDRNRLVYLADLGDAIAGKADWKAVARAEDRVVSVDAAPGGDLYLRSAAGTPRYHAKRLPAGETDFAKAEFPATASLLTAQATTRDALYFLRRDGATLSLWRRAYCAAGGGTPALERVTLPFEGKSPILKSVPREAGGVPGVAK